MGKVNALIVAGGKGKRMNSDKSKQFLDIHGKPLIHHTLEKFSMCPDIDDIYLVLPEDEITYFEENILKKYKFNKSIIIVKGGKERQDSVYNGLISMKDCELVLIHDGARPLVSDDIIKGGIKYATLYGGAAPGIRVKDTIKIIDESGFSKSTLNREELVAIQTPQCFKHSIILEGHNHIRKNKILVTDDTAVLELIGHKVFIYEGSYDNIKVTTKEDLRVAELIINGE